jgi:hypothetical protein
MKSVVFIILLIANSTYASSLVCRATVLVTDGTEQTSVFNGQATTNGTISLKETFRVAKEQFSLDVDYKPAKTCGSISINFNRKEPDFRVLLFGSSSVCPNQGFDFQSLVTTPAFRLQCSFKI